MKFLISIVLIGLLGFMLPLFAPWWTIAIAGFIVTLCVPMRPFKAWLAGFLPIFLIWGVMAYIISRNNGDILAHKVSLLILKADNPFALVLLTAAIGGIVTGFGSATAAFIRKGR